MTDRQKIIDYLKQMSTTVTDLAKTFDLTASDVINDLEHIERSLQRTKSKLEQEHAYCRKCDYVFSDRKRFSKPHKCPSCRGTYIAEACFSISEG